jgi:hypothetical protein
MTKLNEAETIRLISDLARESEIEDPIDWGYLNITEESAYELMASHVVENFTKKVPEDNHLLVLYATLTKLLVENFVLQLKLQSK